MNLLEAIEDYSRALRFRAVERAAVAIRRHHGVRLEKQSRVGFVKQIDVAEADRAHGVAVIRAAEGKEFRAELRPVRRANS